jgi:lipoyl(octanoyl) transferase
MGIRVRLDDVDDGIDAAIDGVDRRFPPLLGKATNSVIDPRMKLFLISFLATVSVNCFVPSFKRRTRSSFVVGLSPQQLGTFESLVVDHQIDTRTVELFDWSGSDPITFQEGWDFQKDLLSSHLDRLKNQSPDDCDAATQFHGFDSVVMLQHSPIYTLGTASDPDFVLSSEVEVVRMDRGGEVTYHGPGQLVVYPILDLRGYKQDIHWYMRAMEESILLAMQKAGISCASREDDVTGVWIGGEKVAALGIKARRWVTQHGLAVNVTPESLANFDGIVPCGLEGRNVTCVNNHLSAPISVEEFAVFMKEALEEIFCIKLITAES